jgi:hypothetical protein
MPGPGRIVDTWPRQRRQSLAYAVDLILGIGKRGDLCLGSRDGWNTISSWYPRFRIQ